MDSLKTARNVAIVLAIAAGVYFLPGGGRVASTFEAALWVAFGLGIGYLGLRMYREYRVALHGLGDRHRGMLYGAVALGVFAYMARARMWQTGFGELAWFVLIGLIVYAAMEVYRRRARTEGARAGPILGAAMAATDELTGSEQAGAGASLLEQRRALPDQPGVYLFRDAHGRVIYVGKAKSVRKRVASHFSKAQVPSSPGHAEMVAAVENIECVVVAREADALLAEQSFIKQYRPRFNIRLRDDKSYPFIAISLDEDYPRVYFTRERHRAGRAYFGPYSNAKRVRATLEVLMKVFMFRSCTGAEPGRRSGSPCLDYFIKRCESPVRRLRIGGGVPREHRRRDRLPQRSLLDDRARPRAADACGGGGRGVRAGDARAQPDAGSPLAAGATARDRCVGRDVRRDRGRGGRARGQRAGLPGARWRAVGPPVVLSRERDRARAGRGRGGVHAAVLRRVHFDPGAARAAARARARRGVG